MSETQRSQILSLRDKMIKAPLDDPRVGQALRTMKTNFGSQLHALGLDYAPAKNASDDERVEYYKYVGAVQSAIDAWSAEKGQPPTPKDMIDTIGPQLLKTHAAPGMFGTYGKLTGYDKPFFDVPDEMLQKTKADLAGQGVEASDDEVYRATIRELFKTLYKSEPSGGGQPTPPASR